MTTSLKNLAVAHSPSVVRFATISGRSNLSAASNAMKFPKRPDFTVLSETIPLFYIGRNKYGFWVARESEGRCGGMFLRQRSALRFAKLHSQPVGCATMLLNETFELDIENKGGRLVALLSVILQAATQRVPTFAGFVGMAIAEWRKLVAEVARAFAGARRNRDAIERELFHGHYRLISKIDDDLPIA